MLHTTEVYRFLAGALFFTAFSLLSPFVVNASSTELENVSIKNTRALVKTRSIASVSIHEDSTTITVAINCDSQANYLSVKKSVPLELVLIFTQTSLSTTATEYDLDNAVIDSITTTEDTEKDRTNITIALKQDTPYRINRDSDTIRIVFDRPAKNETEESTSTHSESQIENYLIDIVPELGRNSFKMVVRTSNRIENLKTTVLTNPPRIVFDLFGVTGNRNDKQTKLPIKSAWISHVRYFAHPEKLRVVLDTKTEFLTAFTTESLDDGLLVLVGPDIKSP